MKIVGRDKKIITLEEFFARKEETRKLMAGISFEEKIKALVSLQEIAHSWGKNKDVIVWKTS